MTEKKLQRIKRAGKLGQKYELIYHGCGQCTLAALQDVYARNSEGDKAVFKACSEFRGGVGKKTDGICGCYAGGVAFLSSIIGRERDHFDTSANIRERACELVDKLHDYFIKEYGSVICRDILQKKFGRPFYLFDDEDFRKFEELGYHDPGGCDVTVGKAAEWVATIIEEEEVLTRTQPPLSEPRKPSGKVREWLETVGSESE
jgi:C_GCAxxG_C_C family probable redox protein